MRRNQDSDKVASSGAENTGTNMDLEGILKAIDDLKTVLKGDNTELQQNIDHLGHEINGKLDSVATEVQDLAERVDEAEARVHQVENWAKEATEALRSGRELPTQYIETLLRSQLQLPENLDLKIQRAHCTLAGKPPPGAIIVNFLEFSTKEKIVREVWKKGKIQVGSSNIHFNHNNAPEIVMKSREYIATKKVLKEPVHIPALGKPATSWRHGIQVEEPATTNGVSRVKSCLWELLGWQPAHNRGASESSTPESKEQAVEFPAEHFEWFNPQLANGDSSEKEFLLILERVSILAILLNCVTLGMFQPCGHTPYFLQALDDGIFAFFAGEMVVKMVALGVIGEKGYLGDTWNRLDFFIVIVGMLEYSLDGHNVSLSAIRTVRVLRPLRAINRVPSHQARIRTCDSHGKD
ncbi:hypothetical protein CCH79_00018439 [Gambusia affinis]|uniref:Ion transport domain-containing protein n=1 Tax=Gambusia affinis TaxID=33528 RepID=A0A315VD47_GAMAF|nr:hypothetical protein CCH79_00018439 [Gambusia affinis]